MGLGRKVEPLTYGREGTAVLSTYISPYIFPLQVLAAAIEHAKSNGYCARGDSIVALHRIGNASVIKIVDIK